MKYTGSYRSKADTDRNFKIFYGIIQEGNSYCIEAFVEGGLFYEKTFIGNCGIEKAKSIAKLLAKNGVHPVHIEDIISDMLL